MPNFAHLLRRWSRRRRSACATALSSPRALQRPVARRVRVGHRLERGEGLRRDDEQRLGRVEVARRLGEVGAVDVGDEAEGQLALAVVAQRLVGHHRAEVRAADADVDDVADALAGVAGPRAARARGRRSPPSGRARRGPRARRSRRRPRSTAPRGARRATCSTARFSVMLIFSPRNIASIRSRSRAPRPARRSSRSVSSVMRFFE